MKQGIVLLVILAALSFIIFSASDSNAVEITLAPLADMPDYVQAADVRVQEAYQFAAANPHMLTHQPCYCGCVNMGHMNNEACYIKEIDEVGTITFDNHASVCGICIDITHDVMNMTEAGKSQTEIRHYIDETYGERGPGTETDMPPNGS